MRVLIIIPCFNEEKNIETVVDNITHNYPEYDYLVVNDCSTDNSEKICKERQYNYITLCTNLGIGGGVQAGYQYAVERDYDFTVQIDGDGQHDPKFISEMIKAAIQNECDMVVGSRFLYKEGFQSSVFRRLGIAVINFIIRICCGKVITDATSGFRIANKELTRFFAKNYAEDYPEPEAILEASLKGYKIMEYPVIMKERMEGKSSINWKRSIYYMIKVSLALVLLRMNTKKVRK